MKRFHWFETKQLDRVTNFSTETECISNFLKAGVPAYYYCSFSKKKVYYGLNRNIKYLGVFKNKYIKYFEFRILVILKSVSLVLFSNYNIIMVNQNHGGQELRSRTNPVRCGELMVVLQM